MNFNSRYIQLQEAITTCLSAISEFPQGLLPHTVYVEEEGENYPVYKRYELEAIYPDGTCTLCDPQTGERATDHYLNEINIDWLLTIWQYYGELTKTTEQEQPEKELRVFLFPNREMPRDTPDEEILKRWNDPDDDSVKVYTPDELAAYLNDDEIGFTEHYVRFIKI